MGILNLSRQNKRRMTLNYMKYCDVDLEMISPKSQGGVDASRPPLFCLSGHLLTRSASFFQFYSTATFCTDIYKYKSFQIAAPVI